MKMGGTRINNYHDLIQKYFYVICDDSMISPFFVFARLRLLTLLLEFKNHLGISLGSKLNIFKNLNNLTGALLIYRFSPNKDYYEMIHFIYPIALY